jgi:hypothetical protein
MTAKDAQKRECDARCGTEMRQGEAVKWGIILKSTLRPRNRLVLTPRCRRDFNPVELVPTLMIDDAETKLRTEAALLFELKTSVPFYHTLQICGLIYIDIYLATGP